MEVALVQSYVFLRLDASQVSLQGPVEYPTRLFCWTNHRTSFITSPIIIFYIPRGSSVVYSNPVNWGFNRNRARSTLELFAFQTRRGSKYEEMCISCNYASGVFYPLRRL